MKRSLLLLLLALLLFSCGKKEKKLFTQLSDLDGYTAGVVVGTTHDNYVSKHFTKCKVLRMNETPDLFLALDKNQCDFILLDGISAIDFVHERPEMVIFDDKLYSEFFGMAFNKDDAESLNLFNKFLKEIKENGVYDEVYNRWNHSIDEVEIVDIETPTEGDEFLVGIPGDAFPFSFVKNEKFVGIDVELMERFAVATGRNLKFVQLPFGSLIASLATGKIDAIAALMTITEERSKQVAFSDSYYESYSVIICKKDRCQIQDEVFKDINDLKNHNIGVLLGSSQDSYVTHNYKDVNILRFDLQPDLIMSLTQKQCDAILYDAVTASNIISMNPEIAVLNKSETKSNYYFGFQKGDNELTAKFNAFLKEIKSNGVYDEVYYRWINNTETAEMPVIENSGRNGKLRCATTGQSPVFSFIKDNELAGFDIEIVYRFGAWLEKEIVFSTSNFEGILASLITKKVDVIANTVMFTEERAEKINYSEPYFESNTALLVLKEHIPSYLVDRKDIETSKIAAMTGTTGEMYIREHFKNADIQCFDNVMDAIAALQANKVDYTFTCYTTAVVAQRTNNKLILLPEQYLQDGAVISMKKGRNPELLAKINEKIKEYKENGILDEIIKRWIDKNPNEDYVIPDIPQREEGELLKVGTAANREPMIFVKDNTIQGVDAELIQRIAYDLGYRMEFVDMSFSALLTSLAAEKVDLLIANMTSTEERAKTVDFSEPYYVNPQIMMCMDNSSSEINLGDDKSFLTKIKESFYNNLILEKRYKMIFAGLYETIIISVFSIILGVILGSLICYLRMRKSRFASGFAKTYIDIIRGIPVLVLLMIMFYVIFASVGISATIVAVITFAINFSAYVSEMFRTAIQGVDKGQTEAGVALGFTKTQTFINIVLPQAVKTVMPVFKGESISLIKMTSIVGYIAIQDLTKASDIIRSRTFDAFFPLIVISIIYFILAWLLGLLLDSIGKKRIVK